VSTGEIAKAICTVMSVVKNVEKTGRNDFHKYDYASEADLLRAVQPAMASAGLALFPLSVDLREEGRTSARGKAEIRSTVVTTYRLVHTSGESLDVMALGSGIDGEDKGVLKAQTAALKYALRQLFLIPTGDDPDAHGHGPAGRQQGPSAAFKACQGFVFAQLKEAGIDYEGVVGPYTERHCGGRLSTWEDEGQIRHFIADACAGRIDWSKAPNLTGK